MIEHIVMWKFKPGTEPEQEAFLEGLNSLYGVIPQIVSQQIRRSCVPDGYDAALISRFQSLEDLAAYKADPRHQAVSALCKKIRTDRAAVDCEV